MAGVYTFDYYYHLLAIWIENYVSLLVCVQDVAKTFGEVGF